MTLLIVSTPSAHVCVSDRSPLFEQAYTPSFPPGPRASPITLFKKMLNTEHFDTGLMRRTCAPVLEAHPRVGPNCVPHPAAMADMILVCVLQSFASNVPLLLHSSFPKFRVVTVEDAVEVIVDDAVNVNVEVGVCEADVDGDAVSVDVSDVDIVELCDVDAVVVSDADAVDDSDDVADVVWVEEAVKDSVIVAVTDLVLVAVEETELVMVEVPVVRSHLLKVPSVNLSMALLSVPMVFLQSPAVMV